MIEQPNSNSGWMTHPGASSVLPRVNNDVLGSRGPQKKTPRRMQGIIASVRASLSNARRVEAAEATSNDNNVATSPVAHALPTAPAQTRTITQLEARSYDDGLRAGAQARFKKESISAYQRVGLDPFARGFRAGYFANRAHLQMNDSSEGRAAV